jgi:hypothetical protein
MKFKLAALAAMMAIGVTPAHAVSSSSASFTSIVFQLVDLNPADGIESSLTFLTGTSYGTYVSSSVNLNDPETGSEGGSASKTGVRSTTAKSTSQNFGTVSASANVVGNNATTLTGAGTYTSALSSMSASGSADNTTVGGNSNYNATAQTPYSFYNQNFLLSANTILIVTANGSVTATNTVGYDGMTGQSESSYASASFNISGTGASGSGSQGSNDSVSANNYYWYGAGTQSTSHSIGGSFMNLTGSDLGGTLSMHVNASGDTSVVSIPAPVPEPESYAMMLAGLAAIGAMARRRKQK